MPASNEQQVVRLSGEISIPKPAGLQLQRDGPPIQVDCDAYCPDKLVGSCIFSAAQKFQLSLHP